MVYFKKSVSLFSDKLMQQVDQSGVFNSISEALLKKKIKSNDYFKEIIRNQEAIMNLSIPSWYPTFKISQLLINPSHYGYSSELNDASKAKEYFEKNKE